MVEWTTGAVAAPNYTSRNQVSGQLQRLDEAGKFTKEATVLTEEAVAKTAVAFSATAELISTTMRGSTKAAAAMLIRLTRGNEARAAAVLENVMHTSSSSTRVMQEHATRTALLFAEVIRLHVQAAADLVIALMGRSAKSSDMLMSTLVENMPGSAYQLLTVIISRGDTHAQQLFVHILRNRAANGMPLLTKMLPHFVPMLRKELCVRLKQKNVDGGIKLGNPKLGALYYLRFVNPGRRKPKTEFGRRLQAETIPHDELITTMAVELLMTSETVDAPPLLELPPIPLEYQPLHDDLLPPLPDDWSQPAAAPAAASAAAPAAAPASAPAAAPAAAAALPQFDGDGVVVFDLNLRMVATTGDEVGVALIGVGPLPNLFGQLRGFTGKCDKLRIWWNLNEKTARLLTMATPTKALHSPWLYSPWLYVFPMALLPKALLTIALLTRCASRSSSR